MIVCVYWTLVKTNIFLYFIRKKNETNIRASNEANVKRPACKKKSAFYTHIQALLTFTKLLCNTTDNKNNKTKSPSKANMKIK